MPEWIRHHLTAMGRLNHDGVSRKARLRECRRCGGPVIVGLDHDPCGIPTTTDPTNLDQLAEMLAIALGRRTYSLTGAPTLERRDPWSIAGRRRYPVLADHRCRDGVPLRIDDTVLRALKIVPPALAIDDNPPF